MGKRGSAAKYTISLHVMITPEMEERIANIAQSTGQPVSAAARYVMITGLRRTRQPITPELIAKYR